MSSSPEIAIIIRARNEERWIGHCLRSLTEQSFRDFEVVLVDNNSTDLTVRRARSAWPELKVVTLDRFRPGYAINEGIRASSAPYLVCLSAHCLPATPDWLAALRAALDTEEPCAGAYGRQIPMSFSPPEDQRDLLITFGLDRRVQYRDPFFHNANSIFPRRVWEQFPFDEEATNVEDRIWAKAVLEAGHTIVYEPEAPVYHYHGIHQSNDPVRARNVLVSMEQKSTIDRPVFDHPIRPEKLDIVTIVPVQRSFGDLSLAHIETLLERALRTVHASRYLSDVIVSTDDDAIAEMARAGGAIVSMRSRELERPEVRFDQVLQGELTVIEDDTRVPDYIMSLEITYPFRHAGLLDKLVVAATETGAETTLAGRRELRPCWRQRPARFERLDHHQQPRDDRDPLHVGLPGLGCLTLAHVIREGRRFGEVAQLIETDDPLATIEVRDAEAYRRVRRLLTSDRKTE